MNLSILSDPWKYVPKIWEIVINYMLMQKLDKILKLTLLGIKTAKLSKLDSPSFAKASKN